jgi:hypothetical protein
MPSIFNALPGIEVPAGAISKGLAQLWADTAARGEAAPSADDVKATQVNLVLLLGFNTTPEDGVKQFDTAVKFSRRYPCRVVVLCPLPADDKSVGITAKIYGECHLGKSKGDTRCCEFVMLSYAPSARQDLENQVSVCLSTDLPMYYWAHRFASSARMSEYQYLLRRSKRVLFDSAIAPEDALTFPWPKPEAVRDLAHARLLPVRQSIGQFLSNFTPSVLADGLTGVTVVVEPALKAEGRVLSNWVRERLKNCGAKDTVAYESREQSDIGAGRFEMRFDYADKKKSFVCACDLTQHREQLSADFGNGKLDLPVAMNLLSPEAALGEAMFF